MRDLDWLHENEVIIQLLNYTSGKERSYEIFNREIQSIPHDWLEATETNQCKTIIFQMVQEVPKGNKRHMERNQETSTKYIQADKNIDGSYSPTEISTNLSLLLESYEYGDVAEGNFQVWEYPSGDIYQIEVDRTLNEAQYYTTSRTTDGVKWKPVLRNISNDQDKVKQAYAYLSKQNNSRYNS